MGATVYGMIPDIDNNFGSLRAMLNDLGVAENSLFISTTDNGTATGELVFNAGMRGKKGSEYDGGHPVHFIAHWPVAVWNRQHASDRLCHAVDVVPTLAQTTEIYLGRPDAELAVLTWHDWIGTVFSPRNHRAVREGQGYQSPGMAHATKASVHFTVTGEWMEFDDVRVWQAKPLP